MIFHPEKRTSKLSALYAGPYKVVRVRGNVAYVVPMDQPDKEPKTINFERLSLCYPELADMPVYQMKKGEIIASPSYQADGQQAPS